MLPSYFSIDLRLERAGLHLFFPPKTLMAKALEGGGIRLECLTQGRCHVCWRCEGTRSVAEHKQRHGSLHCDGLTVIHFNRSVKQTTMRQTKRESRAFGTRIPLTSCPILRADSNFNMPTYAETASLLRIKAHPFARSLFPQNSHVHFFLSPSY